MIWRKGGIAAIGLIVLASACASVPPAKPAGPLYPEYALPGLPAALGISTEVADRYAAAWQRFQSGDHRGAAREFGDMLRRTPALYPAETAIGLIALADRQFQQAAARFSAALARDDKYAPALQGLVDAQVGLENWAEAASAMDRWLALDPTQTADSTRVDMIRFRQVQSLVDAGRRLRAGGRLDEAELTFTRALALSPSSALILRELAVVELSLGQLDEAEVHARRAADLEPNDAETHATLGAVFEATSRFEDAAGAFAKAAAVDPAAWRAKAASARATADTKSAPPELAGLADRATVTRGELAALVATRLRSLVERAPKRLPAVATDIRSHWAAAWIVPVTQGGVMEVFSNHTFQPASTVRRGDLARVIAELLPIALVKRTDQLTALQAERPAFPDVSTANAFYRPAAIAVASGAIQVDAAGRFAPTRPATGAEAVAAIARVADLAGR